MAEPPLLVEELKIGKEPFAEKLAKFLKEGYRFSEDLGSPTLSAYFLDLNRYFLQAVRHVLPDAPAEFLDFKPLLKKLLAQEGLDPHEKTAYWLDLAAYFNPKNLSAEDAADLLTAHTLAFFHPPKEDHPLYSKSEATHRKRHLLRFQKPLSELLASSSKNEILSAVLQAHFPESKSCSWKIDPEFPLFSTEDETFSIDVTKGKWYQKRNELTLLPSDLKKNQILKPFIQENQSVRQRKSDQYEWTRPGGLGIRAAQKKDEWIFQCEMEPGVWAELTESPKNFPLPGLLQNRRVWIQTGSSPQPLWISHAETGTPLYRIEWKGGEYLVQSVDPAKPWDLVLPEPGSGLERLDERGFVFLWKDRTKGEIVAAQAPRLGLEFKVANGKAILPEYSSFTIQNAAPNPLAMHCDNSLVLENGEGKQKIFFPNPLYRASISEFKQPKKNGFVFDVIEGALQPQEKMDHLYLAIQKLQAKDYEATLEELMHYGSLLRKFSDEERLLLEVFIHPQKGGFPENDASPPNIAIRMKAISILVKDVLDFQGKSFSFSSCSKIVEKYIQYQDQTPPSLKLSKREEKWILSSIKSSAKTPLLKEREKNLKGNSAPVCQHPFLLFLFPPIGAS